LANQIVPTGAVIGGAWGMEAAAREQKAG